MKFTILFILISIIFLLTPIASAHHGNNGNIYLTKPDKVDQVKNTNEYKVTFSYYPVGNTGIIDFSVQIENLNSGFYYKKDAELQIINTQGVKQPTYDPFVDDENNFKMRRFLEEVGEYKLIVRISPDTDKQEIEFPFVVSQMNTNVCSWCNMSITNKKTVHYLSLNSGEVKQTCCLHCAINTKKKYSNKLIRMETLDYFSEERINNNKAWFVKDSNIVLKDSMSPYILAFSSIESAKEFQKKYLGNIINYARLEAEINENQDQGFASGEIDQLLSLEEFFYNIKKNYYKDMDIKKLVELSVERVMKTLDKNSSLKKIEPSSLEFIRGFERDNTIENSKIINGRVGYVKIKYFGRRTKEDFKKVMTGFDLRNIKSLIIDLRDNPGGSIDEAMQIMQYFVPNGNLLASTNTKRQQKSYFANTDEKWEYPLAILINENTASSAEIFAASLRYYKKAVLIGSSSYGKSTIQQQYPLNNEYTLVLTVGKCYLPDGEIIKESGIKSDRDVDEKEQQLSEALKFIENINAYDEVFMK